MTRLRFCLAILLSFLLCASPAFSAITVDGTSTGASAASTSVTVSYTAGGNGLFVCVIWTNPTITISDVTYGGTSILANNLWSVTNGGVVGAAAYLMLNPPAGAANVVATMSGTVSVAVAAVGLAGMQTSSLSAAHRTVYTASGAIAPSVTATDSQNGDVVLDCMNTYNTNATTLAVGSGQTVQKSFDGYGGSTTRSGGTSSETATGSSTVMSWTAGTNAATATGTTSFVAAGAVASCNSSLLIMGVGAC